MVLLRTLYCVREATQRNIPCVLTPKLSFFKTTTIDSDPVERLLGSLATEMDELDWRAEQSHIFDGEIDESGDHSFPNSPSILQPQVLMGQDGSRRTSDHVNSDSRFKAVTDEDTSIFVESNKNKNTVRKTIGNLKILNSWLESQHETRQLSEIPPAELNRYLARYFLVVRRNDGTEYEPDTLRCHLGSFSRHLKEKNYSENIVESDKFKHCRDVLNSKMKELKKQGRGNKKRKAYFLEEDVNLLYDKNLLGAGKSTILWYFLA